MRLSRRTAAGDQPLVPLSSVRLLGRHLLARRRSRRRRSPRLPASMPEAMTRAVEGFTRPRARAGAGRRVRRRALRQRLEGHQHRGGAARDRELRSTAGRRSSADDSRAATSRDLREPLASRRATVVAIGEARPLIRAALGDVRARRTRPRDMAAAVRTRLRARRRRDRRSCSRRRARASTCSATTRNAAGCSNRKCARLARSGTCDARAVSSHQPGRGGEELAAGNAGCPGLRGWCLPPAG